MQRALELAEQAASQGEVPVGAVLVLDGQIVGEGFNQPISSSDPTAHAELVALRDAASNIANYRIPGSTLYVTIEPCTMCAGAMIHARVERVVYGASEPKSGVVESNSNIFLGEHLNHKVLVTRGVLSEQCSTLLKNFFRKRRQQ